MAYGPDGRIYVTQTGGTLVAIKRGTRSPRVLVRGLRTPLGLAWRSSTLFVSEQGRLERFRLSGGRLQDRRVLVRGLPFGRHQQDNVVVGPGGGRLYWGSGSTCDICREKDRRSATILSLRPDGTDLRVVARGLRNPYGLAFQPGTGRLYATVNGQDEIGTRSDPEPAEMLVVVRRGRLLRLARLLAQRAHAAPERPLPRRHRAGRLPRAALLGRWARLLHRPQLPARLRRERLHRRMGRVPERPFRPPGRTRPACARRPRAQREHLRRRLRPSAGAAGRSQGRPPRRRLGPRPRVPDPGPRPALGTLERVIGRRDPDKPGCGRRGVLRRLAAFLSRRRGSGCGDWLEELPPDSFVREPRRPRPSAPSTSVALDLPDTGP